MKFMLRVVLAAAMQTLLTLPASAQWQGEVGVSQRHVTNTEYDKAGRQLVRESGWLPGAMLGASYQAGRFNWLAEAEISNADIAYHGQTQAGTAADSRTSMNLAVLRLSGRYAFSGGYSALAAIEWERSRRDINGITESAGLQEKYRTNAIHRRRP